MNTHLGDVAEYHLPVVDILEKTGFTKANDWVGKSLSIKFTGNIHCVVTGKKIRKTFGEGMSYEAFLSSPLAVESIVRPELSRIHEGIALRDREWEEEHHNRPHYVYLSRTSGVKVGVTRTSNVPSRWIDQGATEAIIVAETPYRQLAGLMEVALKAHMADKTAWQAMLKNEVKDTRPLDTYKSGVLDILGGDSEPFFYESDQVTVIRYPVLEYPAKVKSLKLDNEPEIWGKLLGIKGQYLIFDGGRVLNVRSHAGYQVEISWE
ncbi:MAG: DUF2797 domain-containing protein [Flavobacteriales bacterium]|nr:DUF2797 domain-containing protein [Flavobacteriales bacterium]